MAREAIPLALLEALRALNIDTDITTRVIVVIDHHDGVTVHVDQRVDETSASALARALGWYEDDVKWIVNGEPSPVPAECGAMSQGGLIGPCVRDKNHSKNFPGSLHCTGDGNQWTDNSLS